MRLICFAHRLEAIHFFTSHKYQHIDDGLYQHTDHYILITGEGIQAATESLCQYLVKHPEVNEVINLGVAAGNPQALSLNEIHSVRTIYRQKSDEKMEFTSFTTIDKSATTDLISTESRIHNAEVAKNMFLFADLIDREAWGLASVCKRFKKPLRVLKYVSDDATKEACSQIKDIAEHISEKLYTKYLELKKKKLPEQKHSNHPLPLPENFHFSFTQKSEFEKLTEKISLKENKSIQEVLQSISYADYSEVKKPKERTKVLLLDLQKRLDPFTFHIRQRLDEITQAKNNSLVTANYDKTLESDEIQFHLKISSENDLDQAIRQIKDFPFYQVKQLLRGENVD